MNFAKGFILIALMGVGIVSGQYHHFNLYNRPKLSLARLFNSAYIPNHLAIPYPQNYLRHFWRHNLNRYQSLTPAIIPFTSTTPCGTDVLVRSPRVHLKKNYRKLVSSMKSERQDSYSHRSYGFDSPVISPSYRTLGSDYPVISPSLTIPASYLPLAPMAVPLPYVSPLSLPVLSSSLESTSALSRKYRQAIELNAIHQNVFDDQRYEETLRQRRQLELLGEIVHHSYDNVGSDFGGSIQGIDVSPCSDTLRENSLLLNALTGMAYAPEATDMSLVYPNSVVNSGYSLEDSITSKSTEELLSETLADVL